MMPNSLKLILPEDHQHQGYADRQYNWLGVLESGRQAITEKVAWYIRESGTEGLLK